MRLLMIALLFLGLGAQAQVTTGTVMGKVTDGITGEILPYSKVWIQTESGNRFAMADSSGKFTIDALKPGTYSMFAKSSGKDTTTVLGVEVVPDAYTTVNFAMYSDIPPIVIIYEPPVVSSNIPKITIPTSYIEQSPNIRNPLGLLAEYSSEIQLPEGSNQIIIRGSRPGDAVYYIDGVKMTDMSSVPGASIGTVEAYTGGIPAKYGDTTGGVVIVETKSYFDLYNAWLAGQ